MTSLGRRVTHCRHYKFLGKCEDLQCRYSHDKPPLERKDKYEGYVTLPDGVPVQLAVGKGHCNLKRVYSIAHCYIETPTPPDRKFRVIATSPKDREKVLAKLKAIFAQQRPLGNMLCYLPLESCTVAEEVEFREYRGRLPTQFYGEKRKATMYEVCTSKYFEAPSTASEQSLPVDFECTDNTRGIRGAVASSCPEADTTAVKPAELLDLPNSYSVSFKVVKDYQGDIREQLKGSLLQLHGSQSQSDGQKVLKLEARFGKVLWSHLPEDVLPTSNDASMTTATFIKFECTDSCHTRTFNTDVKEMSAKSLIGKLKSIEDIQCHTPLKTVDLKISGGPSDADAQEKLDVRLKVTDGKPEVVAVRMNERKVAVFDVCCLNRQHDMRLSLQEFQVVQEGSLHDTIVKKMVETIKFPSLELIEFVPHTEEWHVNLIRHKKKVSYVLDKKYLVVISSVTEHSVSRPPASSTEHPHTQTVNLQACREHHEVEFHNMAWECSLAGTTQSAPEDILGIYMGDPVIDSTLSTSISHPWTVEAILKDYPEVMEHIEELNNLLQAQ